MERVDDLRGDSEWRCRGAHTLWQTVAGGYSVLIGAKHGEPVLIVAGEVDGRIVARTAHSGGYADILANGALIGIEPLANRAKLLADAAAWMEGA